MHGMRALCNFKPDRFYHLISRIANRAFYLTDEERTRFNSNNETSTEGI